MRDHVPRDRHVGGERRRLPREHVRPAVHEALILRLPAPPAGRRRIRPLDGAGSIRHWMRRIRHILVGAGSRCGWIERQAAVLAEKEVLRLGRRWRPAIEAAPLVRPGVEHRRLREFPVALALEPIREPARLQRAEVHARGTPESDVAEGRGGIREPLPVVPGTHHQEVHARGVGPLERRVARERPVLVLLVPPAAHGERRDGRVGEVAGKGARPPHAVVGGVLGEVAPRGPLLRADRRRQRPQRRERAVPFVRVEARRRWRHGQVGRRLHHP